MHHFLPSLGDWWIFRLRPVVAYVFSSTLDSPTVSEVHLRHPDTSLTGMIRELELYFGKDELERSGAVSDVEKIRVKLRDSAALANLSEEWSIPKPRYSID